MFEVTPPDDHKPSFVQSTVLSEMQKDAAKNLWEKVLQRNEDKSPDELEREFADVVLAISDLQKTENKTSLLLFENAIKTDQLVDSEGWKIFGYKSYREFLKSPESPFKAESTGYAYAKVGKFLRDFDILDQQYFAEFLHDLGIDPDAIVDDVTGVKWKDLSLAEHVGFTRTGQIAGLVKSGKLEAGRVNEMFFKAATYSSSAVDAECKEVSGHVDPTEERLEKEGVWGTCFVVPIWDRHQAIEQLESLAEDLRSKKDFIGPIEEDDVDEIGGKKITFYKVNGQVVARV